MRYWLTNKINDWIHKRRERRRSLVRTAEKTVMRGTYVKRRHDSGYSYPIPLNRIFFVSGVKGEMAKKQKIKKHVTYQLTDAQAVKVFKLIGIGGAVGLVVPVNYEKEEPYIIDNLENKHKLTMDQVFSL